MAGSAHLKAAAAAVCVLLVALALAGQPAAAKAVSCVERCGPCVPCPKGMICTAVCTVPQDCIDKCHREEPACKARCAKLSCSAEKEACKAAC
ncbi:hypothetical protein BRADI_1g49800v3 [Brachypodium distachyon]|uniref:Bowman-Birk serine protease inhibitors family domain-containing protein n=1 Tax=Brachypodium distachyon TaxID=15368 RepID=A0A0Q3H9V0_BRADI|nr:hypothetical protein BRADI_1g49800v3 [Brachypodium distachyon]